MQGPNQLTTSHQVSSIELCAWLGGFEEYKSSGSASFLTIEEVGKFLNSTISLMKLEITTEDSDLCLVPVNLKEQDAFHLTIEEYLLALISMVEELVSLSFRSFEAFTMRDQLTWSSPVLP